MTPARWLALALVAAFTAAKAWTLDAPWIAALGAAAGLLCLTCAAWVRSEQRLAADRRSIILESRRHT